MLIYIFLVYSTMGALAEILTKVVLKKRIGKDGYIAYTLLLTVICIIVLALLTIGIVIFDVPLKKVLSIYIGWTGFFIAYIITIYLTEVA